MLIPLNSKAIGIASARVFFSVGLKLCCSADHGAGKTVCGNIAQVTRQEQSSTETRE